MKKSKKLFVSLLAAAALLLPMPAKAAEVPYQTYTYDKWGNATPAPNGYLPTRSLSGAELGCGDFKNASDLFYCEARKELYIVDSGNARIVILDNELQVLDEWTELTLAGGSGYTLSNPQGICVLEDGTVYIADMGNQEIVICNRDGQVQRVLGAPQSYLLPDNFNYQPTKVVVDKAGRIYVLSKGIYQGIIYMEQDGTFIKFFGANDVEMTLQRRIRKIWKDILSDKAAATMQAFNPIEYGNLFLGEDGYIYATAAGSESGAALVTRLNPLGIDTLPAMKEKGKNTTVYADIAVDENGIMTFLDTTYGNIYQMDENGSLMFAFGGLGNQVGLFKKPVSLVQMEDALYIMDADKNTITEFKLTQFGEMVRTAINLYNDGLYEESIEPWREVTQRNSNYLLAYTGLGKAYYQLGRYEEAMYYYSLANDRSNYSDAFKEASLNKIRDSFSTIVLVIMLMIAAVIVYKIYRKRRKGAPA